jgi:hypothetical protein
MDSLFYILLVASYAIVFGLAVMFTIRKRNKIFREINPDLFLKNKNNQ